MTAHLSVVVFDLGGVLIDWNPRHLYRKLFQHEAEMEDFLAKMEIFQGCWSPGADFERIVIVDNRSALGSGQDGVAIFSGLMKLTAFTPSNTLIMDFGGILGGLLR